MQLNINDIENPFFLEYFQQIKMSSYKNAKNDEIIVSGYIKEILNKHAPNDIIDVISSYFDIYYLFDTFNIDGKCAEYESKIINVNGDTLLFRDNKGKITLTRHRDEWIEFFKNKSGLIISNGCMNSHQFVYTLDHNLYGFGRNDTRQIGMTTISTEDADPTLIMNIPFESPLIEMSCSRYYSLFLTKNGNIYGCGRNEYNCLTSKYNSNQMGIQKIINTGNIVKIGCCLQSNFMLDNNNILKVFGKNPHSHIFSGDICDGIQIMHDSKIITFSCGYRHIGFITKNDELIMQGDNGYWQCGKKSPKYCIIPEIKNVKLNGNIMDIKCGGWHNIVTVNDNEFYSFGCNGSNFRLLNGKNDKYCLPELISNEYIMKLTKSNQKILDIIPTTHDTYILQEIFHR